MTSRRPGRSGGSRPRTGVARALARATWAARRSIAGAPLLAPGAAATPVAVATILRALAVVHAAIGPVAARVPALAPLAPGSRRELAALLVDLAHVAPPSVPSPRPAIDAAIELASGLCVEELAAPGALVGVLWALARARSDGLVPPFDLAARAGLEVPLASTRPGRAARARAARSLAGRLARALAALGPRAPLDAARGATSTFEALARVVAALAPVDEARLTVVAVAVNPEAGRHAMPSDPRVLAAALAAGRAAWARFPYLARRFGARGERFTASDGAWLATLVELPRGEIRRQLRWLREVLARRGLPGIVQDDHVARLAAALADLVVVPRDGLAAFEAEARALSATRDAALPPAAWAARVTEHEARLAACPGLRLDGAAELVMGAVVDEADGLDGSLAALRSWLGDAYAGSTAWLEALDAVAADTARALAAGRPSGEARP